LDEIHFDQAHATTPAGKNEKIDQNLPLWTKAFFESDLAKLYHYTLRKPSENFVDLALGAELASLIRHGVTCSAGVCGGGHGHLCRCHWHSHRRHWDTCAISSASCQWHFILDRDHLLNNGWLWGWSWLLSWLLLTTKERKDSKWASAAQAETAAQSTAKEKPCPPGPAPWHFCGCGNRNTGDKHLIIHVNLLWKCWSDSELSSNSRQAATICVKTASTGDDRKDLKQHSCYGAD